MGQDLYKDRLHPGMGVPIIGANSVQFTSFDGVYADSNGFLALATAGSKILGFARQDVTLASDNQTVAKVKPSYLPHHGMLLVYGADQACTQTDIGAYADYGTATTGAFNLNLAAGATGQFLVLGFGTDINPNYASTDVVCEVAEPQVLAFAQS